MTLQHDDFEPNELMFRAVCPVSNDCPWTEPNQARVSKHIREAHPEVLAPEPRTAGHLYVRDLYHTWTRRA